MSESNLVEVFWTLAFEYRTNQERGNSNASPKTCIRKQTASVLGRQLYAGDNATIIESLDIFILLFGSLGGLEDHEVRTRLRVVKFGEHGEAQADVPYRSSLKAFFTLIQGIEQNILIFRPTGRR